VTNALKKYYTILSLTYYIEDTKVTVQARTVTKKYNTGGTILCM
jgi:hypothetical protein